jgi:hypothetical protein
VASFVVILGEGRGLIPLGTLASDWPVVPGSGDGLIEILDRLGIGKGNRGTWRKPAPVPLCPPQIPHDLTWDWIRAIAVGNCYWLPKLWHSLCCNLIHCFSAHISIFCLPQDGEDSFILSSYSSVADRCVTFALISAELTFRWWNPLATGPVVGMCVLYLIYVRIMSEVVASSTIVDSLYLNWALFVLHTAVSTSLSDNICDRIKFRFYLAIPDGDFILHNIQGSFNQYSSFKLRPLFPFDTPTYVKVICLSYQCEL